MTGYLWFALVLWQHGVTPTASSTMSGLKRIYDDWTQKSNGGERACCPTWASSMCRFIRNKRQRTPSTGERVTCRGMLQFRNFSPIDCIHCNCLFVHCNFWKPKAWNTLYNNFCGGIAWRSISLNYLVAYAEIYIGYCKRNPKSYTRSWTVRFQPDRTSSEGLTKHCTSPVLRCSVAYVSFSAILPFYQPK